MKLGIGTVVKIHENLKGGSHYGQVYCAYSMEKYCGMTGTIVKYNKEFDSYLLSCAHDWYFNDQMFTVIVQEQKKAEV